MTFREAFVVLKNSRRMDLFEDGFEKAYWFLGARPAASGIKDPETGVHIIIMEKDGSVFCQERGEFLWHRGDLVV